MLKCALERVFQRDRAAAAHSFDLPTVIPASDALLAVLQQRVYWLHQENQQSSTCQPKQNCYAAMIWPLARWSVDIP